MYHPTYEELLQRIKQLEDENRVLRIRCGRIVAIPTHPEGEVSEQQGEEQKRQKLSLEEKVALFRRVFRGREDVFARRWHSGATGKSGYQPVCRNEWVRPLCDKKKYKCSDCPNRQFESLSYQYLYNHLAGKDIDGCDVIGLYALLEDGTCYFLCADFDDKSCEHGYKEDVLAFVAVCDEWHIPVSIERSRSGNGAHVWAFFTDAVPAAKARRLGYALLHEAMNRSGRISFKSYDRFLPNQDQLSEGGLGNLIALPLQGQARKRGNAVFVDRNFQAYSNQWAYLSSIQTISLSVIDSTLQAHQTPIEFSRTSEGHPWETPSTEVLRKEDFPSHLTPVRSDRFYLPLHELSGKTIHFLRRLASFRNPEFFKRQAMRFSTYATPRIISCAEVEDNYIALPRGCEDAVASLLNDYGVSYVVDDKTVSGSPINISFNGHLYARQQEAVEMMLRHRNGVLCATTAFGKTVTAIGLIAHLKVSTLILVHTKALQTQWVEKLYEFLSLSYPDLEMSRRRGRHKTFSLIGSGKERHGIIDVATFQSCISDQTVQESIRQYGLVIVDECHHVSAVSFEQVLKSVKARYVYGLTATPIRKDGLQPIIFMQCGPIRYQSDAQDQMAHQTFRRLLRNRFTTFHPVDTERSSYTSLQKELAEDEARNQQIVEDVVAASLAGRTPIVITTLRSHVKALADLLSKKVAHVVQLIGTDTGRHKRLTMEQMKALPATDSLVVIATGKYIGEGFDFPRLDTLFLAMPISWKGIVAQYAGRLHRSYDGKETVQIYDYIDIRHPVCEKMYRRRLKGYASIGYKVYESSSTLFEPHAETIFDGDTFEQPFLQSLLRAKKSICICAPRMKSVPGHRILQVLSEMYRKGVPITVFTDAQTALVDVLQQNGARVQRTNSQLCYAIIDKKTIWYGSINYLGPRSAAQNAILLENAAVAADLLLHSSCDAAAAVNSV